ncbi:hypothetical protein [Acinetobacter colistiniresistens]|uniref:hypothetical protein n=1 Tax=Acinetobacter colistiniresistens TaxID=280145 RepID=UPI0013A60C27|nr:hypothetical protein [Acinetobacter colistiniresistens]
MHNTDIASSLIIQFSLVQHSRLELALFMSAFFNVFHQAEIKFEYAKMLNNQADHTIIQKLIGTKNLKLSKKRTVF